MPFVSGSLQGLSRLTPEPLCTVCLNQRPFPLPWQPARPFPTQTDSTCDLESCAQ